MFKKSKARAIASALRTLLAVSDGPTVTVQARPGSFVLAASIEDGKLHLRSLSGLEQSFASLREFEVHYGVSGWISKLDQIKELLLDNDFSDAEIVELKVRHANGVTETDRVVRSAGCHVTSMPEAHQFIQERGGFAR